VGKMRIKTARRFLARNRWRITEVNRGNIGTPSFIRRIHDAKIVMYTAEKEKEVRKYDI